MATSRTPRYWCANFDFDEVLGHGVRIGAWLLQYQYEHGGFEYQGNRRQKGRTTAARHLHAFAVPMQGMNVLHRVRESMAPGR